uniref:Alpha-amylase n=2 Tax=Clastoptera arizonana TaxID=38151 RepID=A0A1B6E5M0_9HEMI
MEWWRTALVYQIYPRSFMDSDDDGVGDLKGISSKVDYLKEIGVDAVWLSPIYKSPMADFGYDISNFTDVDPIFGNMDDLKELLDKLKAVGIRVLMDFVPNHSSDEHLWFQKSVKKEEPYTDFYVWKDAIAFINGEPQPPNNWQSVFSGSAWEWNEERNQFYLHQFAIKQPDLNYRNSLVVEEMTKAIEFWLDLGVDGFRVDAAKFLVEEETMGNETKIDPEGPLTYSNMDHSLTTNREETYGIIRQWSELVKEKNKDGKDRVLLLEVYNTAEDIIKYYGGDDAPFQMPFNFFLLEAIRPNMTAKELEANVQGWLNAIPKDKTTNWVVGNHDNRRIPTRAGEEMADAVNMILAMLPGMMVSYNGEELGMKDTFLTYNETVDPSGRLLGPENYQAGSRDPERTPMQWDDSPYAGFSNKKPWLPVNPNYWNLNVKQQNSMINSHLKVFKDLSKLRGSEALLNMTNFEIKAVTEFVLLIKRWSNTERYYLLVNLDNYQVTTNLTEGGTVKIASINSGFNTGDKLASSEITLRPKTAIIFVNDSPS